MLTNGDLLTTAKTIRFKVSNNGPVFDLSRFKMKINAIRTTLLVASMTLTAQSSITFVTFGTKRLLLIIWVITKMQPAGQTQPSNVIG